VIEKTKYCYMLQKDRKT